MGHPAAMMFVVPRSQKRDLGHPGAGLGLCFPTLSHFLRKDGAPCSDDVCGSQVSEARPGAPGHADQNVFAGQRWSNFVASSFMGGEWFKVALGDTSVGRQGEIDALEGFEAVDHVDRSAGAALQAELLPDEMDVGWLVVEIEDRQVRLRGIRRVNGSPYPYVLQAGWKVVERMVLGGG